MPEFVLTAQGERKRVYRWYATPWEILRQLPGFTGFLREGLLPDQLERQAKARSDIQAALEMQDAKRKLFARLSQRRSA